MKNRVRPRISLWVALGLSLAVHALWSLWPAQDVSTPEAPVLTATLETMPPPPAAQVLAPATPRPPSPQPRAQRPVQARAERHTPTLAARTPSSIPAAPEIDSSTASATRGAATTSASDSGAATSAGSAHAPSNSSAAAPGPPIALPPRVDLAYKVYLGTQGFILGDATYRFEHDGTRYRISTVGQARGLAALFIHGTGRVESRGIITAAGLKPLEFAVERGSAERREIAYFDWTGPTVSLNNGKIADLAAPAFDPLTILWQPYFAPPTRARELSFSLATTRKVTRYTLSREADETIHWAKGDITTERWYRRSDDGKTEAWFWLAPSLHYIPVRMRVTRTARGTLEARLDSIRVDAAYAGFGEDPTGPTPPPGPEAKPRSAFSDATGS
jgi:hypothetical protein